MQIEAGLTNDLERARAEVRRIEREIAAGPCRQYGHEWKSYGGCNAGCGDLCNCSVPVNVCSKCGDCDYGDNTEADKIRRSCADRCDDLRALQPLEARHD